MLEWIIPNSMLFLGAILLIVGSGLVFIPLKGKVPWDRIGAYFAFIGGFGVGGGAGGWIGRGLASIRGSVLTKGQQFIAQAVGVGVVGGIIVLTLLWAWSRANGKGIDSKSKARSLLVVAVLALAGTILAAIPGLYGLANDVVSAVGATLHGAWR